MRSWGWWNWTWTRQSCQWSDNNQHRHLCPSRRYREQQAPSTGSTAQRMAGFPQACGQLGYDWLVMSAKSRGGGGGSPSSFLSDTELNRLRASNSAKGVAREEVELTASTLTRATVFIFPEHQICFIQSDSVSPASQYFSDRSCRPCNCVTFGALCNMLCHFLVSFSNNLLTIFF